VLLPSSRSANRQQQRPLAYQQKTNKGPKQTSQKTKATNTSNTNSHAGRQLNKKQQHWKIRLTYAEHQYTIKTWANQNTS